MSKTFIIGHKKPDTDSVVSAIGLSYLKNILGDNTEARIIGDINKETEYALKYFNTPVPKYLNDVKLQLRDIDYHKGFFIKETDSILHAYQAMLDDNLTGIPVVKEDNIFYGLITIKDLSRILINDNIDNLYTSYDNLLYVLKAKEINCSDNEIRGNILVTDLEDRELELTRDTILVIGNSQTIIEHAINKGVKMIILTNNSNIDEIYVKIAQKNKVNIICTPYDTYKISRFVVLANYIKTMVSMYNPTSFLETDFVSDVIDINNRLKHTNYPVVNKRNKCLGLLKITDLSEKHPKQVILVDHNEKMQSVEGLEEAEIIEIFDHHNLGTITTSNPVNFRNMSVGSTSTIVYTLFKEKNESIPREIAGLLLSGILSDTLVLKSPTATLKDVEAVKELASIAGVDYQSYGMDLLKSGTSLEGMTKEDVLYNDYKLYTVNDKHFAIGQFFTMNFDEIEKEIDAYVEVLDKVAEANNYGLVALYVTDIVKNGSYVIYNKRGANIIGLAYQEDVYEGYFIDGCVSRKKHIVPVIMEILEN